MAEILLNKKLFVENTLASAIKLFVRDIKNAGKYFPLGHRLSRFLDEILLLRSKVNACTSVAGSNSLPLCFKFQ